MRPAITGAGARRLVEGGERIVVTGAGGWLGLATLEMLSSLLGQDFSRRVACFGARGRTLRLRGGIEIGQRPIESMADLSSAPSLVLHFGFIAQGPHLDARDYVAANQELSGTVLSAFDRIGATAVFQASSGAVYAADPYGGSQSKGLYGALKRGDEAVFAHWAAQRGATAVIGRVFNLSGPHINRRDSYALASMIGDAQAGRPIRVRAAAPVFRSYVAIETLMGVVFGALTEPPGREVRFETAGERVVEMGELAEAVAATLGAQGIERPAFDPAAPADRYVGDPRVFNALARRYGVVRRRLPSQIRQTAAFMAERPE